jgi:hypothetical protein
VGVTLGWPGAWGWPTTVTGTWNTVPIGSDVWVGAGGSESGAWIESPSASGTAAAGAEWGSGAGASTSGAALPPPSYWYYCTSPSGYYPHVQECSSAWIPVIPQAPSAAGTPPQVAPVRSSPSRVAPAAPTN